MPHDPNPVSNSPARPVWWRLVWVLRNAPVVAVLMFVGGVVLTVAGFTPPFRPARTDGFAILPEGKRHTLVQRVDLPPEWRLKFVRTKQAHLTGVFAPDGTFAFRVSAVAPQLYLSDEKRFETYSTLERFTEVYQKQPGVRVERRVVGDTTFAVARREIGNSWVNRWDRSLGDTATQLTFFAERRLWCLQFDIPPERVARFEPDAERLFLAAETIPADDPRADATDPNSVVRDGFTVWSAVGLGLLAAGVVLFFGCVWVGLVVQVWLWATGRIRPREVPFPHPPPLVKGKPQPDRVREAAAALEELGFVPAGWYAMGDVEDHVVGAWRHPNLPAAGFVVTTALGGPVRVRFVTKYDHRELVTTSRRVELSYAPPPGVYIQQKRGNVGELWAWHREAEWVFAERRIQPQRADPHPIRRVIDLRARVARHHTRFTLWFLRYEPFGELWRMWRWGGKAVGWQIDRGWVLDPESVLPPGLLGESE